MILLTRHYENHIILSSFVVFVTIHVCTVLLSDCHGIGPFSVKRPKRSAEEIIPLLGEQLLRR